MIRKNEIMIGSDHKSETLFWSPRQKVGGGKWRSRTHKTFYAAQNLKFCFFIHGFLQISLRDFWFFHYFTHFDILKNAVPIIEKSVWWSFKNKKSEMYIFFIFPCPLSWYMTFFQCPNVSGGKLAKKMGRFWFLEKIKNLSKGFAKIRDWKKWFFTFCPRKKCCGFEPVILNPQLFVGGFRKGFQFFDRFWS